MAGGHEPSSLQAQRWHCALALLPEDPCRTPARQTSQVPPLTSAPLAHPAAQPQAQARSPAGFVCVYGGGGHVELGLRERALKQPRCVCDRIRKRQNLGRWVKRLSGRPRVRLRPRTPNSPLFPLGSHRRNLEPWKQRVTSPYLAEGRDNGMEGSYPSRDLPSLLHQDQLLQLSVKKEQD